MERTAKAYGGPVQSFWKMYYLFFCSKLLQIGYYELLGCELPKFTFWDKLNTKLFRFSSLYKNVTYLTTISICKQCAGQLLHLNVYICN